MVQFRSDEQNVVADALSRIVGQDTSNISSCSIGTNYDLKGNRTSQKRINEKHETCELSQTELNVSDIIKQQIISKYVDDIIAQQVIQKKANNITKPYVLHDNGTITCNNRLYASLSNCIDQTIK